MPRQLNSRSIADNAINSDKIEAGAVDAADLANGSITTAKIADGAITSGKLAETYLTPTGDGSQLTGIESFTKSSSDPSYNSNATLGDVWINTTSGEVYVCTNDTTNSNVWRNAKGSGNIDFPIASTITADYNLNTDIGPSTAYDITFSNASDSIDTEFSWSISNISNVNVIDSAQPADDAYGTSATFTFTMGALEDTQATFHVNIEDSDGYVSTKQFGITATQQTIETDFLVVAGGGPGGGGYGGGGGAGGYRTSYGSGNISGGNSAVESALQLTPGETYTITVGSGGAGGYETPAPTAASNSSISGTGITTITSIAGGIGNGRRNTGTDGGSGGGGGAGAAFSGTAGQGFDGGDGRPESGNARGGGGGGAGEAGTAAPSGSLSGAGGDGLESSIEGTTATRAGGGGGGSQANNGQPAGGAGGGGSATNHGGTNKGGGGGGGCCLTGSSGNGGSGVVILRMATADYTGTYSGSPLVSTSGSDTILIFNGSGSYTA